MNSQRSFQFACLLACSALLTACGGGGDDGGSPPSQNPPPNPQNFTIGGTVSGLAPGASVVLQNNGGDNLSVAANGSFTFGTAMSNGSAYAVTVATQPAAPAPGQNCSVGNGSGTLNGSNVTNVAVTCQNRNPSEALTVTSRSPLPGAVGAKVQGDVITVTFSAAVDPASVTNSSFSVQGAAGPVAGTISFAPDNTQAIFTPSSPATLAFDEWYTVTLTTDVRDPANNALAANEVWRFNTGKRLAIGFKHTCARTDDGRVKCWGLNDFGQLGYDDVVSRGNGIGPGANTLAAVNLGTGRTAVAISAGDYHTCAILDNGDTKCWGRNSAGELGQGHLLHLGNEPGEMAALQPINFGAGRRATEIANGQLFTCARLDDNTVKCWGRNTSGQLGQGSVASLGVVAGDIAAAAPINLGTGLTPVTISLGHYHSCAVLSDSTGVNHVKCWGDNRWGQLGAGSTTNLGDNPGEMGDALPEVSLGTGVTVDILMASAGHNCVKLSDLSTKCWGLNGWGQVGLNAGNSLPATEDAKVLCTVDPRDCIGDAAGEMGDSLLAAVAPGNTARITAGYRHSCALLTSGTLTCWGSNEQAQLGLGDIAGNNSIIGDQAGEMAVVVPTQLKPGKIVEELTAAGFHTCAWNTDDTLNCWGHNSDGQLGRNDIQTWGDNPNEMGANLIDVDLGP